MSSLENPNQGQEVFNPATQETIHSILGAINQAVGDTYASNGIRIEALLSTTANNRPVSLNVSQIPAELSSGGETANILISRAAGTNAVPPYTEFDFYPTEEGVGIAKFSRDFDESSVAAWDYDNHESWTEYRKRLIDAHNAMKRGEREAGMSEVSEEEAADLLITLGNGIVMNQELQDKFSLNHKLLARALKKSRRSRKLVSAIESVL